MHVRSYTSLNIFMPGLFHNTYCFYIILITTESNFFSFLFKIEMHSHLYNFHCVYIYLSGQEHSSRIKSCEENSECLWEKDRSVVTSVSSKYGVVFVSLPGVVDSSELTLDHLLQLAIFVGLHAIRHASMFL